MLLGCRFLDDSDHGIFTGKSWVLPSRHVPPFLSSSALHARRSSPAICILFFRFHVMGVEDQSLPHRGILQNEPTDTFHEFFDQESRSSNANKVNFHTAGSCSSLLTACQKLLVESSHNRETSFASSATQ